MQPVMLDNPRRQSGLPGIDETVIRRLARALYPRMRTNSEARPPGLRSSIMATPGPCKVDPPASSDADLEKFAAKGD